MTDVRFATATALNCPPLGAGVLGEVLADEPTSVGFLGVVEGKSTPAADWFEDFHVISRVYDFGLVSAAVSGAIEVYSAFRTETRDWTAFANNAGANSGISIGGLPTLPRSFAPQTGLSMTIDVAASGDPLVDSTLDFTFDTGSFAFVSITLQRVVPFILRPETGYIERLEWLTNVLEHADGSEQRISLRKNPRQFFEWNVFSLDGFERTLFHHFLYGQQIGPVAVAIWHFMTKLTSATAPGVSVLPVQNTSYGDYRVGGQVLIYEDETTFDILTIQSVTSTSITLTTVTTQAFVRGALVAPVRTGKFVGSPNGSRFPTADSAMRVTIRIEDNDSDLADTSGFASSAGKVLFTDCNIIDGSLPERFDQRSIILDSLAGAVHLASPWSRNKRVTQKGFFAKTAAELWSLYGVLHALRGRQISFFLPSFSQDLQADASLVSGQSTLTIVNVGYTKFVGTTTPLKPRTVIRILFNDGNPTLTRTVLSAVELSATQERLTVDTAWGSTFSTSQIERIEYSEKSRFDTDDVTIVHSPGSTAKALVPVRTVFE